MTTDASAQPKPIIDDCETFHMSDDCIGVVWHEHAGWFGNLHWAIEGDADFVGPFTCVTAARLAVRASSVEAVKETGE